MSRLAGRVALVTGGSRGIGRAIALELAREGADVAIVYRREEQTAGEVAAAIAALGRRAHVARADVADFDAVAAAVAGTLAELGRLDVVVANSGVASRPAPVASLDPAEWHRVIGVDLNGVFHTCRAAVPHLATGGSSAVIVVSSVGADLCSAFGAPYYAAKAGVNALTKVLAKELAPSRIRVNAIAPGVISTDMGDRLLRAVGEEEMLASIPLGRPGRPEEVGRLAAYLASDDAGFVTGQIWRIDGGAFM